MDRVRISRKYLVRRKVTGAQLEPFVIVRGVLLFLFRHHKISIMIICRLLRERYQFTITHTFGL